MPDFIRRYELQIGLPIDLEFVERSDGVFVVPSIPLAVGNNTDFDNKGFIYKLDDPRLRDRSILVTDLNIKFDIKKQDTASANTSTITIYNLSEDKVGFLDRIGTKGNAIVSLSAGYEGRVEPLIYANIEDIETIWEGEDRVTTLSLAEGAYQIRDSLINKKFKKGTEIQQIITDLINRLNLNKGSIDIISDRIDRDVFMTGKVWENLVQLGEKFQFTPSVDNLTVNISDNAKEIPTEGPGFRPLKNIRILTPDSGYIGNIVKVNKNKGSSNASDEAKSGVEFMTLLDPAMGVGSYIEIKGVPNPNIEGIYKAIEVEHKGEYEGIPWFTKVVADVATL